MKKIELFEHNEIGYNDLIKSLKKYKCTTLNRATGTGKSFIILKFLYENRDKKALYITPTYPIIDQVMDSAEELGIERSDLNVDTMIYRNLLDMDMKELYKRYDIIIFDECHKIGADKTFKKIKELKYLLSHSNDNKIFIGLTATPIRYLDDERNMTVEIFDGNVASTLSLAEAMLEEILPVPQYIVSKAACKGKLDSAVKNIQRMAPTNKRRELEEEASKIDEQIGDENESLSELIGKYIEKRDGKYIIFCNNINELNKYYEESEKWFKDFPKINRYKVHSKIANEGNPKFKGKNSKFINRETIKQFEKSNEGISLLFCVDILNEGVHVHGIDGIFMLRKTMSPIIYFQQIGRCLSFSGRKRQIKIFDMVNNFNNHDVIKILYEEVQEEFRKKIKQNPENKEKYERVLKKFEILDETKAILKKIDEIKKETTTEKIIESKIEYSIEILKNYITKSESSRYRLFEDKNAKDAYNTIANYYIYVDNEQFQRLLDLGIILPEDLSMTMQERIEMLEGYNTIAEKEKAENGKNMERVMEFIKQNSRIPRVASNDLEEKKMAKTYLSEIANINVQKKIEFEKLCIYFNVKLTPIEKALFNMNMTEKDITTIINLSSKYLSKNREIPEFIVYSIEHIIRKYDIQENKTLFNLLEKSEKIKRIKIEQKQRTRYELILKIEKYLQIHINDNWEELENSGIMSIINKMSKRDINIIRKKYEVLKEKELKKRLATISAETMESFCKKLKLVDNEMISEYCSKIQKDNEMNIFIMDLLIFIQKNDGNYPSIESEEKTEKDLAIKYNQYMKKDEAKLRFIWLQKESQNGFYNPKKILFKIASKQKEENETKITILEYLDFFQRNGRKPLINSLNENEKKIARKYRKKCLEKLSAVEINYLNKIFNRKENFKKTCEEYFENATRFVCEK